MVSEANSKQEPAEQLLFADLVSNYQEGRDELNLSEFPISAISFMPPATKAVWRWFEKGSHSAIIWHRNFAHYSRSRSNRHGLTRSSWNSRTEMAIPFKKPQGLGVGMSKKPMHQTGLTKPGDFGR
jgi:hypothetical protein